MASDSWKELENGPIERLEDNLWRVEGALPNGPLRRVMTVARLGDGRLVIHNGICLDDSSMAELERWGTPAFLVVPSAFDRMDAAAYKERYPEIEVLCPRGALRKVAARVTVAGDYDAFVRDEKVQLAHLEGVRETEGFMMVRHKGKTTLVLNDALLNMSHQSSFFGFLLRPFRFAAVANRSVFRDHLLRLSEMPNLSRIILSHHETITEEPGPALRAAAKAL